MLSTLPPELVSALVRQRWLLPVLARFHGVRGLRFAELLGGLGLPRDSLVRTLEQALAQGWIERNQGHGHPLRPEYVLTARGMDVAETAAAMAQRLTAAGLGPGDLTRWSLPALRAIALGADRFNDLARGLAPASPRALSQALRTLVANDLVARDVEGGFPPSSRYRLTVRGWALAS
jgi:DNA-binding HxlR family transcriptional regulator